MSKLRVQNKQENPSSHSETCKSDMSKLFKATKQYLCVR